MTPGSVSSKKLALIEQDPGKRMGNWEKLVHPVARRAYFVNKDTGQASWTTPAEVGTFLVLISVWETALRDRAGGFDHTGGVRKAGGAQETLVSG